MPSTALSIVAVSAHKRKRELLRVYCIVLITVAIYYRSFIRWQTLVLILRGGRPATSGACLLYALACLSCVCVYMCGHMCACVRELAHVHRIRRHRFGGDTIERRLQRRNDRKKPTIPTNQPIYSLNMATLCCMYVCRIGNKTVSVVECFMILWSILQAYYCFSTAWHCSWRYLIGLLNNKMLTSHCWSMWVPSWSNSWKRDEHEYYEYATKIRFTIG